MATVQSENLYLQQTNPLVQPLNSPPHPPHHPNKGPIYLEIALANSTIIDLEEPTRFVDNQRKGTMKLRVIHFKERRVKRIPNQDSTV